MAFITHNLRLKQYHAQRNKNAEEVKRLTHSISLIEQICPHERGPTVVLEKDSQLYGTNDLPKYRKGGKITLCAVCGSILAYAPAPDEVCVTVGREDPSLLA